MTAVVPVPEVALQKQVLSVSQDVKTLSIRTNEEYVRAAEISKNIAALKKQVCETFDPIISKAYAAHKEACAQRARFLLPLETDQKIVDGKILFYSREQERIRRQCEEELAAAARKEQEAQALREAEELEKQGEPELANVVLENQIAAPAPVVSIPSSVPKVQGIASRTNWRWRVKNEALIPREYLCVDEIKINGVVRALKDKTQIAGIEIFSEDSAIHRG